MDSWFNGRKNGRLVRFVVLSKDVKNSMGDQSVKVNKREAMLMGMLQNSNGSNILPHKKRFWMKPCKSSRPNLEFIKQMMACHALLYL